MERKSMSWAEEKAQEVFNAGLVGRADVERAIRETIEKCAEVAGDVDLSVAHGKLSCSDEQAGGEATEIAVMAIRKLGEP